MDTIIKLNIGCGDQILEGYINVDLYDPKAAVKADARELPHPDSSVDEILASHVIEHFDFHEGHRVLREWYRVLKPGGRLMIETPDMVASCRKFVEIPEEQRVELYGHFFSTPWIPGQEHKFLFTESQLVGTLQSVGFKIVARVPADRYPEKADINMKFICEK